MKRLGVIVAAMAAVLSIPGVAHAAWTANGTGSGYARSDAAPTGNQPTASVTGRNVAISWTAAAFGDGTPVNGYVVRRYDAGTGMPATVGASCSGTITTLSCTESAVDPGSWYYTVTPKHFGWTGAEGLSSANADVAAPSLTFTSPTTVLTLPGPLTGTLASFVTGETVTWRLDDPSTGTVLVGSIVPSPVPASGSASFSVTIPAGTPDGPHTVYAVGSSGASTASGAVVVDTAAPIVSAAVIQKSAGGVAGYVRQGGTYYVYANVTDAGSPVATVTADVSTITTGTTAAPLAAGSWTVTGVAYNYRSALLTASNPLAAGAKAFSITATDANAHTGTTGGFSVTVDNTRPQGASLTTANGGGTLGVAETGDSITYTYTEPIDPNSIVSGWDGTTAQTVTLRLLNAGGGGGDRVQIWDSTNTVQLPLGVVRLGSTGYTATSVNFTNSTMTISGNSITVVLGTPSGPVGAAVVSSNTRWNPSVTATDRAGNACRNNAVNEPVPADPEF
jgi:hypothetical protein